MRFWLYVFEKVSCVRKNLGTLVQQKALQCSTGCVSFLRAMVFVGLACLVVGGGWHCQNPATTENPSSNDAGPTESSANPISFPAATAKDCQCDGNTAYGNSHNPAVAAGAEGMAVSPDGKLLIASSSDPKVWLYLRENPTDVFAQVKHEVALNQNAWRVRFAPDGKTVAIVMDKQIELWDVAKSLQDPGAKDTVLFTIKAPDIAKYDAADVAFLGNKYVAAGFYGATAEDPIQIWEVAAGQEKPVLTLYGQAIQSLVADTTGKFLVAGGRKVDAGTETFALLHFFTLSTDGGQIRSIQSSSVVTTLKNTNFATVDVSPDNRWIAAGSAPDLKFQRNAPRPPESGDHGRVLVWSTQPFQGDQSISLRTKALERAHPIFTRHVAFRPDGKALVTLGVGSPMNSALMKVWGLQDAEPQWDLAQELAVSTPGRSVVFTPSCLHLLNCSLREPYMQMWRGCKP